MTPTAPRSPVGDKPPDPNLIYINGIDPETGTYAVRPRLIDNWAKIVKQRPGADALVDVHPGVQQGEKPRSFAAIFDRDLTDLKDVGWAVVVPEDGAREVRDALAPLIEHRRKQAGDLLKILDYKKDEQVRDWYDRHKISAGTFKRKAVPYYLLLAGPPTAIPFEFQYLLGVEYAVGRVAFDTTAEYGRYATSVVAYETAAAVANRREIVYWGTRHMGDPATKLSASMLIGPLAKGLPQSEDDDLKEPIHANLGYTCKVYIGDDAKRKALLGTLCSDKPPAFLFTASHGMAIPSGRPNQITDNGALLCQDWPGFGGVRREHYLAAADVPDDANVSGLVAFFFACFGAGTPHSDQFLMDLSDAGKAPPLAPQPFVAALPRRLLTHPKGGALAVVGHVDRAWGFSIEPPKMTEPQIGPFRNSLGFILRGAPVGFAISLDFGQRYATLSTQLLNALSPTAQETERLSDRALVTFWLERNDAQNYVILGDPAVRIREDAMA